MESYSLASVRLEAVSVDAKGIEYPRPASGFLIKYKELLFLVTNWHVVTGLHFQTNKVLDEVRGLRPTFLKMYFHIADVGEGNRVSNIKRGSFSKLELYQDPECFLEENYTCHPIHGKGVDVVAIQLSDGKNPDQEEAIKKLKPIDMNIALDGAIKYGVMSQVFVVGFPLDTSVTPNKFPVYKAATIASEPGFYNKYPIILIDGKTKPGMSGSPVVVRPGMEVEDSEKQTMFFSGRTRFIGVYSGRDRVGEDMHTSELGIMWPNEACLIPILEQAISDESKKA